MYAKTTILLWLAAMAACCVGNTITIGNKKYTMTTLVNDRAFSHIVVNNGHVLHRKPALHVVKLDTLETIEVEGLDEERVQDLAMDDTGAVWLATKKGLYMMASIYSNATLVAGEDKDLWWVAVDSTNTVYAGDEKSEEVFVVRDNALHMVPGIKAVNMAISNNGDVYYIVGSASSFVSKKKSMEATEVTKIPMPGSYIPWNVELDEKTDTLYIISSSEHLFYVPPGGTAALQVDGLIGTTAIGTDDQGNIYVGTTSNIYKLTPVHT